MDEMTDEQIYQAIKFQVEFYFGQTNYHKDEYLKNCEGKDGWILLSIIYGFRAIMKFAEYVELEDLFELMKLSSIVDVKEEV